MAKKPQPTIAPKKPSNILRLKNRPIWKLPKGHNAHRSGAGEHISVKYKRTRGEKNRGAINEQS